MSNQQLVTELNRQLSNWNVLNTKLHNFHWYVKGENFFTLHEKFEEFYNEAATNIDEIAERILTIGGKPVATLTQYLEGSSIKEAAGNEVAKDMVSALAADFTTISKESDEIIRLAEENGDEATADMFIALKSSIQQHTWMLNAFLGK
ncbi:Dps family protein [Salipaludibacillus daqingensis]|uniref:Dps family protein n=1 Tax=Salipaludibacillus daqingensis TaxID=3041001 RepID=UPI0024738126|nr:Dps family protein [Salipaludibacillus daqingensis]